MVRIWKAPQSSRPVEDSVAVGLTGHPIGSEGSTNLVGSAHQAIYCDVYYGVIDRRYVLSAYRFGEFRSKIRAQLWCVEPDKWT